MDKKAIIEKQLEDLYNQRIEDKVSDYTKDAGEILDALAQMEDKDILMLFTNPTAFAEKAQEHCLKEMHSTAEYFADYPTEDDI